MFVEEEERLYESGPEESDFDAPEGVQLAEVNVRSFKLTRVFMSEDIIPQVIINTDLYDEFLSALYRRYPAKTAMVESTAAIIQHFNE
jgi:hypothetical protein